VEADLFLVGEEPQHENAERGHAAEQTEIAHRRRPGQARRARQPATAIATNSSGVASSTCTGRNCQPAGWNDHGWRSTNWKRRPASALCRFHSSSGSHAIAPIANAAHTRASVSTARPRGRHSKAIRPAPIVPAKR
jgi:hypothetical protein